MAKTGERPRLANLQPPSLPPVAEQPKELDFNLALEGARGPHGLDGGLSNALFTFLVLHGQGGLVVQDILGG